MKVRTPVSRSGKGDSTYWSECVQLFESNSEGFEIICPNCLEIERLNKRRIKHGLKDNITPLPMLAYIWSGEGFGERSAWADNLAKQNQTVLFIKDLDVYVYTHWDKPLCSIDQLGFWFNVDPSTLTDTDECVTLEKI